MDTAGYYDIISDPEKRLAHEGEFLLWLLERAPGKRVLDMACGTGVQAEFLARHGATALARDIDPAMLAVARAKRPHTGVTYEAGDMRRAPAGKFDLVIIMGNSISLLATHYDIGLTLEAVDAALAPGGIAFVHVVNYAALEFSEPKQKVATRKEGDIETTIVKDMVPTGVDEPVLVAFSYFEKSGPAWRTAGAQAVLLNSKREFLERRAGLAGLTPEGAFGDYDRSPFDPASSPDLLLVFRG